MTGRPFWAGRTLALTGILLVALSLRTPVAALSPILDRIGEDIALDPVVLGRHRGRPRRSPSRRAACSRR